MYWTSVHCIISDHYVVSHLPYYCFQLIVRSRHLVSAILAWQGHRKDRRALLAIGTNSTKAKHHIVLGKRNLNGVHHTHEELVSPLLLRTWAPQKLIARQKWIILNVPVELGGLLNLRQRRLTVGSRLADIYVWNSCQFQSCLRDASVDQILPNVTFTGMPGAVANEYIAAKLTFATRAVYEKSTN